MQVLQNTDNDMVEVTLEDLFPFQLGDNSGNEFNNMDNFINEELIGNQVLDANLDIPDMQTNNLGASLISDSQTEQEDENSDDTNDDNEDTQADNEEFDIEDEASETNEEEVNLNDEENTGMNKENSETNNENSNEIPISTQLDNTQTTTVTINNGDVNTSRSGSFKYYVNGKEVEMTEEEAKEKQQEILNSVNSRVSNTLSSFFGNNSSPTMRANINNYIDPSFSVSPSNVVRTTFDRNNINIDLDLDKLNDVLPINMDMSPTNISESSLGRSSSFRQRYTTNRPLLENDILKNNMNKASSVITFSPEMSDMVNTTLNFPSETNFVTEVTYSNKSGSGSFTTQSQNMTGKPEDYGFKSNECEENNNSYICDLRVAKCEILKENNSNLNIVTSFVPCAVLVSTIQALESTVNNPNIDIQINQSNI